MMRVLWSMLFLPAVLGLLALPAAARAEHHHIHHAIYELDKAAVELKEAPHDFGGHREAALLASQAAVKDLQALLVVANEKPATPKIDPEVYKKYEHHPHLHHALHELKEAHKQIKESKTDFGQLREAALKDIDVAIKEIEICCNYKPKKK